MTRQILCSLALAAPLAAPAAVAEEDVFVTNFPEVQRVSGQISIVDPVPQSRLQRVPAEIVAPVAPEETTSLVAAGVLATDGFVSAVLSLAGQVKSDHYRAGQVGALLVPDEEPMLTAFGEQGQLLLPLRVEAAASPAGGLYFGSEAVATRLAFPRYRVYFFNTTDRPAEVTLFAYLTN